jgi:hypothetical protein
MGLYNYVNYPNRCRKCGCPINDWQTKDGEYEDLCFKVVSIEKVSNFYDICPQCNAWNEYRRIDGQLILIDCDEQMEYVKCKNCKWSWEYTYDEDLGTENRIISKKGYYLRCPLTSGLYFEKEPIELLGDQNEIQN